MVTAPGNNPPPMICGTNTGEHSEYYSLSILKLKVHNHGFSFAVFVDASKICNDLAFSLDGGTSTVTRTWSIKVEHDPFFNKWNLDESYSFLDHTIWLQLQQLSTWRLYPIFLWSNNGSGKNLQFWWWNSPGGPRPKHLCQVIDYPWINIIHARGVEVSADGPRALSARGLTT